MSDTPADDPTLTHDGDVPVVRLEPFRGPWPDDDPDANFKADIATYAMTDPLMTIGNLAGNIDVPIGSIVRYVLARWASGGAEGVLELGPATVKRMHDAVAAAEAAGTDDARLVAYRQLAAMVGWLQHGLDDPDATYPDATRR